jgi:hypothetical protein
VLTVTSWTLGCVCHEESGTGTGTDNLGDLEVRALPGSDATAAPGTDASEKGSDAAKPGSDAAKPGSDAAEPGSDAGEKGTDGGTKEGTDSGKPGTDSGKPETDSGKPGTDSGKPGTDGGTPGTDSGACVPGGGARTPGFWANRGESLIGADDLTMLRRLSLREADGDPFDPFTFDAWRDWLLGSNAVNMAYKLSAHLGAMALNVHNGLVDPDARIFAPGTTSADASGTATVAEVMAEANAALATDGYTPAGDLNRAYQEALKDALDAANNNTNFVGCD